MMRQYELVDQIRAYDPNVDEALLNRAYVYATKMHGDQKRASGDPYFSHPVEVAGILAGLKLDSKTIATALLHDTIEDTEATRKDIQELFGVEIARLVEGVTKLSRLELGSDEARQAENFRKLLLATANDVRVLLVKLADRLHNMRTLEHIARPEKRRRIAQETMEIYAPLAGRIGMQEVREELEDLSFRCLNSRARQMIARRLDRMVKGRAQLAGRIAARLQSALRAQGIAAQVTSRAKRPYAIWSKMERRSIALEQLSDLIGFRIIVEEAADCYRALGVVHTSWQTVPGRFKDYISTPKPNGYQSIHSTVIGPEQQRVELQIRTRRMHEAAEYGIAAHWRYKEGGGKKNLRAGPRAEPYAWLRRVVEMLEHGGSSQEFLENTKLEMYQDQVFCFTIKGRLVVLPQGATPIDFAYAIHTEIGDSCVGAKVNGRHVPLRTPLRDGDEVEILRAGHGGPSAAWESIVATGKARSAIRRALRARARSDQARLGREILTSLFKRNRRRLSEKILERALEAFGQESVEALLVEAGSGRIAGSEILETVYPRPRSGRDAKKTAIPPSPAMAVPVRGAHGMAVKFAEGAFPLPGERIVGIMTPGEGIAVYPIDSPALAQFDDEPERWVDLAWDAEPRAAPAFPARIEMVLANEVGALASVSVLLADYESNIVMLQVTRRDPDCYSLCMEIAVRGLKHLNRILTALRGLSAVHEARRQSA